MFKPMQYRLHLSVLVGEMSGTIMDWRVFFLPVLFSLPALFIQLSLITLLLFVI